MLLVNPCKTSLKMKIPRTTRTYVLILFTIFCVNGVIDAKPIEAEDDEDAMPDKKISNEEEPPILKPQRIFDDILYKGQFFQDIFSEQPTPDKIRFGHVCENPREWEQRFEEKDMKLNRHQGKVRWGNEKGGYGEHYWDLNHDSPDDEDETGTS